MERKFADIVDTELFGNENVATEVRGTAAEIEKRLLGSESGVRPVIQRLLSWPGACGTYLSKFPGDRVTKTTVNGRTRYTIKPPPRSAETGGEGLRTRVYPAAL